MRILMLQISSLADQFGGAEYYQHDLISLLAEQVETENIRSIIPKRSETSKRDSGASETPFHYSVERIPFPKFPILSKVSNRFHMGYFGSALALIRSWKPDWIICGHVSLGPVAWALSRTSRIPFATILYGIECWGNLFPQDEFALKHADHLISISHWTKHLLMKRGYTAQSFSVVHPTVSEEFSQLPPPDPSFDLTSPFRLLTISRLNASERYKGQDDTIHALKLLSDRRPDLRLSYTIQGEGDDIPRLRALVALLQMQDIVHFRPAVHSRSELLQSYRNADLFVMPSHFERKNMKWQGEGFGIVYVEAGLCGIPSLAYDCGGVTDIVIDNKTGFLSPPHDVEQLSKRIEFLAEHRDEVEKVGAVIYRHAKHYFSRGAVKLEVTSLLNILSQRIGKIPPNSDTIDVTASADRI